MRQFDKNKILGDLDWATQKIGAARRQKGVSLEDAAEILKIKKEYLAALESGELDKLPPGVYKKNFLRQYLVFLGLKPAPFLKALNAYLDFGPSFDPFSYRKIRSRDLWTTPKIIKSALVVLVVATLFVYLGQKFRYIFAQPYLEVTYPAADMVVEDKNIEIKGKTDKKAQVFINGEGVLTDQTGFFAKHISLKKGLNIISVVARKSYGPQKTIIRKVIVKFFLPLAIKYGKI